MVKPILTFLAFLVLLGAAYFLVVRGAGAARSDVEVASQRFTIPYTTADIPLDPTADWWQDREPVSVHLYPQAARPPYGTEERDLAVRGAFNDRQIGFLLEFEDATEDRASSSHPDACAIMLVPAGSPATAQMMGHGDAANLWHWLADRETPGPLRGDTAVRAARELLAAGPGSQAPMPEQHVESRGVYRDGRWRVVFRRPLATRQTGELGLAPGSDHKISFAVWDGAAMESLSRKSIAALGTLHLEAE